MGFILRLESAFMELSQQYYAKLIKNVKAKRDVLNRETQQLLILRYLIKISFFSEMKQDLPAALRYYNAAYTMLIDTLQQRSNDDRLLEMKIIAGIISYKICKISFKMEQARDALHQFQRHIDEFRYRVGPSSLSFEHEAWMTRQFSSFGDLFRDSVRRGLVAIQTQHPGVYYQQAAQHALQRKKLANQICKEAGRSVGSSPTQPAETRYFGQRPWRIGIIDHEPSSPEHEMECIQLLQAHEYLMKHSWQIIPLLTEAIGHYQKLSGVRMANYLKVLIGEEHYYSGEYEKALVLLQDVAMLYQVEKWPNILSEILTRVLRCSYILGRQDVYITTILEIIGNGSLASLEERQSLQNNLQKIVEFNELPEVELGLSGVAMETSKEAWHKALSGQQTVVIASSFCCVECKASFGSSSFTANIPISIDVHLRSTAPSPMTFSKLHVSLSVHEYNQMSTDKLVLVPGEIKTVSFLFLALPQHIGTDIEILGVHLSAGVGGYCNMELHWSGRDVPLEEINESPWQQLSTISQTSVHPCESRVEISLDHAPPVLVDEWYPIRVAISNTEPQTIHAVMVTFGLDSNQDDELIETAAVAVVPSNHKQQVLWESSVEQELSGLDPGQQGGVDLLVRSTQPATRQFIMKLNYEIIIGDKERPIKCICEKDQVISLKSVHPLAVSHKITNMKCQDLQPPQSQDFCMVYTKECFLLHSIIEAASPCPVDVKDVSFNYPNYIVDMSPKELSFSEVVLDTNEEARQLSCLQVSKSSSLALSLGSCSIKWCRSGSSTHDVTTNLPLPMVNVTTAPFSVQAAMPSFGVSQQTFMASYTIHNTSPLVQEFEVKISSSEYFMLAGTQQTKFRVLPSQSHILTYNMFPLSSGNLPLPPLQLEYTRNPKMFVSFLQSQLPTHIYVKPSPTTATAVS
ncbi:trafficking protein particle complex subunit 11-like isoform X2 [Dysidea avara]